MNKPSRINTPHPRPQFRLGSLMVFTTGVCAVLAVLAVLNIHPLQLLAVVVFFGIGVASVAFLLESVLMTVGARERQQHEASPRDGHQFPRSPDVDVKAHREGGW